MDFYDKDEYNSTKYDKKDLENLEQTNKVKSARFKEIINESGCYWDYL